MLVSTICNSGTKEQVFALWAGSHQRALGKEGISARTVKRKKT